MYKRQWDISVEEYDASEEKDDDALVFEVGDMLAAVSLATYPLPDGEAEINAENNYMWEDAVQVAREHLSLIHIWGVRIPATPLWRRWPKSWRSCWRAAGSSARQIWNKSVHDMPERGKSMSKLSQEEVQSLRSRICHRDQELISTLTPEQFLALLSYDYDTGFAAGKASAQKEILLSLIHI